MEFAVTIRLDQKQLDFVNEIFREILSQDRCLRKNKAATPGKSNSRAAREKNCCRKQKSSRTPKGTYGSGNVLHDGSRTRD